MSMALLLGGARSGKSSLAQGLAAQHGGPVAVLVTGEPRDEEMARRIERHRSERPAHWRTIEEPIELGEAVVRLERHCALIIDCLTLWVANLMGAGRSGEAVVAEASLLADRVADRAGFSAVVSNEVGSGIVPSSPLGREYRDVLGVVNAVFAERASLAALVVAGRPLVLERPDSFLALVSKAER